MEGRRRSISSGVFGLNVSGPLDEDAGEATPLGFTGLVGTASVGVEYHKFLWPGRTNPRLEDLLCRAIDKKGDENCDRAHFREDKEES